MEIKAKRITIKQRVASFGERMQSYRLERAAAVKQAKQDKRNRKVSKALAVSKEAQLSSPEND